MVHDLVCKLPSLFPFFSFRFLHKFNLNFQRIQIFPTWNEYVQYFHHFLKKGFYNHSYLEVVLCLLVSSFKFSLSKDPSKQIIWQTHGITSPALASDPSKSQLPLIVELADWKAWWSDCPFLWGTLDTNSITDGSANHHFSRIKATVLLVCQYEYQKNMTRNSDVVVNWKVEFKTMKLSSPTLSSLTPSSQGPHRSRRCESVSAVEWDFGT